ncbi:MAG: hypothetical protein Q9174_005931 [Haloplaca sp. 1 TL-2023]
MTPLVCAAAAGQVHVVEALLKKKASLKHPAEGNMTALHWASYNGHYEVVDYLLDKKAPVHAANKDGRTSLHLAVMASHFAVAELLLRKGAPTEVECRAFKRPIHYASLEDSAKVLSLLLGYNADAEADDSSGRPLHHAAREGLAANVEVLLARGVDIDARDASGDRALGLACKTGHLAIVRLLLNRGSPLRSKFAKGRSHEDSPLCLAARAGHIVIVLELMNRGASVLQKDEQNWSPLRYASYYAHPEVVETLLEAGATISGNSSSGWGFDLTARRIGFAPEVRQEHARKGRVLQLLMDAERRESKSPEPSATSPPQSAPIDHARAELSGPDYITAAPAEDSRHRPELPGPASEESSSPTSSAAEEEIAAMRNRRLGIPVDGNTSNDTTSGYPSRAHIANDFGFDRYPQQQRQPGVMQRDQFLKFPDDEIGPMSALSVTDPRSSMGGGDVSALSEYPSSRTARSGSSAREAPQLPPSAVQIGPDGMWRMTLSPSKEASERAQSIYEMGS